MIAFVDTETLGLDPDRHPVWEVAVILYDETDDGPTPVRDAFTIQVHVTSEQLAEADPVAQELTGFDARYGVDSVPLIPGDAMRLVVDAIGDAHLAGAVVSFDEERLRRLALAHGIAPRWHYHLIDVEALMVGYLHGDRRATDRHVHPGAQTGPRPPVPALPWKSRDLSLAVGVDPDDHQPVHTALADAGWALACYQAVTG